MSAGAQPRQSGGDTADRRQVWFVDTSALVTMAVYAPLQRCVSEVLTSKYRVLVRAVVDELTELARWAASPLRAWALTAKNQLDWLGEPVVLDAPEGLRLAAEVQAELAAGRPLRHDLEHWGEAAVIALAARASVVRPLFLCDDYNARVAAHARGVTSLSIHKLLHLLVKRGVLAPALAAEYSAVLTEAGRSADYTEDELTSGNLGRAGRP